MKVVFSRDSMYIKNLHKVCLILQALIYVNDLALCTIFLKYGVNFLGGLWKCLKLENRI